MHFPLSRMVQRLAQDRLLLALGLGFALVYWLQPVDLTLLPRLVDWKTIWALAGLMVLSRALELSGAMAWLGYGMLRRLRDLRAIAAVLVLFAAALSAVVTNDVALFVTVPLTLSLARITPLPVGRLVIFQALAVNAGSALSPVGNPQNLFLWQQSGMGFWDFTVMMAPLSLLLLAMVLALIPAAFALQEVSQPAAVRQDRLQTRLLAITLAGYALFLLAVNAGFAGPAALVIIALAALVARPVLQGIDWGLLVVFVLMFVTLGLLGQVPAIAEPAQALLRSELAVFLMGAGVSQVLSNVPAAIFLAPFTDDLRALAFGVSAGGFGLAIGSLANLIALRLAPDPGVWRDFHLWSVPMLALSVLAGAILLRVF
ncbi:MAG: SLC13 family permease [Roseinatronobacter sp.]